MLDFFFDLAKGQVGIRGKNVFYAVAIGLGELLVRERDQLFAIYFLALKTVIFHWP